ncbi:MAG: hypothetical protein AYK19_19890 [Theionarchaea archaeon DG-70-1]|nr:MAG: hypothetical protein AYK19_19890 [Theionarchaea archaeon DG-70-1]
MKTFLVILLMITAQGSILVTEDLDITNYLEYTVAEMEDLPDDLSMYDIIVIATPETLYEESEIEAVKAFVESGGGLMLLAEDNNKDGTTLVLNQLSQEFLITFNQDRIYDDHNYVDHTSWIRITKFPPHPVFQGITTIVYTTGCSLESDGISVQTSQHAYAEKYDGLIIHEKGDFPACMTFVEMGKGRIFACGDKELFDTYISLGDNTLFALNVFDWLAGNQDRIFKRLTDKSEADQAITDGELLLTSANEKGLKEILPELTERAETLLEEAKTLYDSYRYADSLQKVDEAVQVITSGEEDAQKMVDSAVKAAEECLSKIEVGARKYLPSQLDAAHYYVEEIEKQTTYLEKIEKAHSALELCSEIRTGLEGAAEKEISIASEKMESYKGLFGRKSNHLARIHLEYAEDSYNKGEFGDAIGYAQQSQIYSDKAEKEQKKDYILVVGVILIGVVLVYLYVRK